MIGRWLERGGRLAGIVVVVAGLALPARAQAAERLTLAAALQAAEQHFPTVAAARAAHDAARAGSGAARAARFPSLELRGSARYYEEPMLVTPIHTFRPGLLPPFDTTLFQGALEARWTLFDGFGRGARIHAAESAEEAALAALHESRQDLARRVVGAYLDVLTTREILGAQDERLGALGAERDRAARLFRAGRAPQVEVLRAEATQASAEAERVRLAARLDVVERELARLTGMPVEAARAAQLVGVALADTVAPSRRAAVDSAAVASPELAAARARAARAAADLGVARSSRWPRLDAAGQYAGWADDEGHDALEWNVGLQAVQPLWTGGALARGVDRAAAESRGAGEALRLTTIQVEHDVDQALARLEQARARTRSLDRAVARFEEVVRIERLALDAGAGTQTDYLRAEADLLGARADRVEARHGEIAARAELGRIMGGLDAAWIERTLEERP